MIIPLALALSCALAHFEPAAPLPKSQLPAKPAHESDLPIPGVTNSGDATSSIVETVVDAPVSKVWWVFSTAEGFKTLGPKHAQIDFRVGGLIRSSYDDDPPADEHNWIQNQIIAFDPERMLSIRIYQPPANFPFPKACKSTWSVITMEPAGPEHTRVRLAMLGFTPDKESQDMKLFFDKGNAWTLKRLKDQLLSAETRRKTDKAWAMITSLVGDAWRGCATTADGVRFCPKTQWTFGPNRKSVIFSIWFDEQSSTSAHIHQVIAPDASTGAIVFTAVDDEGKVMTGHATLASDDTISMDWKTDLADGAKIRHILTLTLPDADSYTQRIYLSPDDFAHAKPWLDITYKHTNPEAAASPK